MTDQRAKGSGSVYERGDGKWVAQVDNGWTPAGKRRYIRRVRPNRKQAVQALGEFERIKARNLEPGQSTQTLATYLDGWLADLDGNRADGTLAAYRSEVAHIKAVIGKVRLDKLTPNDVRRLLRALDDRGGRSKDADGNRIGGLAAKTKVNIRTTLHAAVEQAVKDRIIDWNPVGVVARPKVDRDDVIPLTIAQARAVLAALDGHPNAALYTVTLAVGLRLGEALGLTWQHIDLDGGLIQVRRQMQRDGPKGERHYVLRDLKSKRSRRDIPLPAFAVDALTRHRAEQNELRMRRRDLYLDGCCQVCGLTGAGLVFVTDSRVSAGRPLHQTKALKDFQNVCDVTIGRRPRIHDLRHSAASLLLAQRIPLHEVQQILGHSSIAVTRDVYGHLETEHLRAATDKMDELLG